MENAKMTEIGTSLVEGLNMAVDKVEKLCKEKTEWSICEIGQMTDMMKDLTKSYKNIAMANNVLSEHPMEKY